MSPDPLSGLPDLPGVEPSVAAARARVDDLLWDRSLRQHGKALRDDVARRNARDSAAIDGIDVTYSAWASGDAFDDSPIGRAAAGVWRIATELPASVDTWSQAPLQVLARLHSVAAADLVDAESLGRPRDDDNADDPLRIKSLPDPTSMKVRLAGLMEIVTKTTSAPAIVEAGVVHAELLAIRPFGWGNGPISRAAFRLTLANRGLDPDLLISTDSAFFAIGRPAYVDAVRSYLTGTPDGVARWLRFCADAVAVGARLSRERLATLA